ncbi:MAG: dicarboxylate/amino acid:cation symporter [Planctomycetales bacterium]|nr:dicarboxylate/amino acid:cation symporter [Planctomycetales bacterium]
MKIKAFLKQWRFTLILMGAVLTGAGVGGLIGPASRFFKPFGDIFLNLLFCAVVPLVFFSIASAVAASSNLRRLGRIAGMMLAVFLMTGIISSVLMLLAVKVFDPAQGLMLQLDPPAPSSTGDLAEKIVGTFTVTDFSGLLSRQNILALIVFSLLIGLASQAAGEKGRPFREFLISGTAVTGAMIRLIMLYAPVGLGAYFAYLVGTFGPKLVGTYLRVVLLYYPAAILYFGVAFSFYAFLAGGKDFLRRFWTHIPPAALTAWGTGSSLAALPANMEAARRIGVPEDVREIVLPLGATIHMDGTCLAAIVKIAVLFSLYGRPFAGLDTYVAAIGVSILCGVVMSGIPGGGFLGEVLIVSLYGFGPEALPIISMLGTLVDPPATMVNSSGDTVAAMMVWSWLDRKNGNKKAGTVLNGPGL